MKKLFDKLTQGSVKLVEKYLPDPFIFAIILTFIVVVVSMIVTKTTPIGVVEAWYGGFWNLLAFSMQMTLVLVTGTILATAPAFKKLLGKVASLPKNPFQAIVVVNVVALLACFVNWGFGLVIGAIFAKEVAKKVKNVDYPLLIAAAYSGFLVWHAGMSGSIPLKLATGGASLETATGGAIIDPITTNLTIFSTFNLLIFGIIVLTLPFVLSLMHPKGKAVKTIDPELLVEEVIPTPIAKEDMTPAERLENSKVINYILAALGFVFIIKYFMDNGFSLNLNIVNFVFLFAAIALHGTPIRVVRAVNSAAKSVGGIILQFPFYAGIMGIMVAKGPEGVSLAGAISDMFVTISNEHTFPLFTFLSAGIVNFFVPSGGGQWAVQAPIMMPAGAELGVDAAKTAMSIAWGDAWTNMIQPFWALPVLGIAKLGAKNIMGYCLVVLLYSGIIISLGLLLF
ncbi:short-chain fatty acid transporter [Candidatus Izimaplasma bacterium ZiA1]|uniref:short-chain fatty acid transporter n=1 Tax=Candidatus Izimoplasma sp. ZiA1 TaxID=2024899 RepID=UPI000BAA7859|nr:short-chain fatty acid transporter [Candidatus Izimaplasma bacterium ZiA1]